MADASVCEYVTDTGSIFTHKAHYTTYLIDTGGNKCSAGYCSITPFGEEGWLAKCGNGYYAVFGPTGLLLADCFYGEPVWVNSFLVYADGASHKYGVMGKNGMVVVPPEYDEIRFLDNSQFELKKGGYKTTVYIGPDLKVSKIKQQKVGG